jgi:choline dehydrogenase-like flavoprotein
MSSTPAPEVLVIGSGMGGSAAAHALVEAGVRVLMLECGPRVQRGPANWQADAVMQLSPYYSMASPYRVRGDDAGSVGSFHCVGGASVFFGAVTLRLRQSDFDDAPDVGASTGARWPYAYEELEPYYSWAERLLEVAGREGDDVTAPPRGAPYPHHPLPPQGPSRLVWSAAQSLGLRPALLPLAIRHVRSDSFGDACARCGTCDGFPCALSAKRDPAAAILPRLEGRGLTVLPDTVAVRLLRRGGRVMGVECIELVSRRRKVLRADHYVLAAGALASPRLVLASGLHTSSPARDWVGRCLMRHCNGIVYGLFRRRLAGGRAFHKQIGIFDLYGGRGRPPVGCLQSIHPPPPGLVRARVAAPLRGLAEPLANHSTGLLAIAEDEPRRENRVEVDARRTDAYGVPSGVITHRYTEHDVGRRRTLTRLAARILRAAGAAATFEAKIRTFSHALGSLRMGLDPRTSPLDGSCRFRGVENLWVMDGSFMPRSGGVNPSLTIAANALRAATRLAGAVAPSLDSWANRRAVALHGSCV